MLGTRTSRPHPVECILFAWRRQPAVFRAARSVWTGRSRSQQSISDTTNKKEDIMQINPYLTFNGQCEQALKFYERVLGARIEGIMTWGEMPDADQFPAEAKKLIMHARLMIGEQELMGADSPPGRYQQPQGINVAIHLKDVAEGERMFNALAEN